MPSPNLTRAEIFKRARAVALRVAHRHPLWVRALRVATTAVLLYGPAPLRQRWSKLLSSRELWQVPRNLLQDRPLGGLERHLRDRARREIAGPQFESAIIAAASYEYLFEILGHVPLTDEGFLASGRLRNILLSTPVVFRDERQFREATEFLGRLFADLDELWSRMLPEALRRRLAQIVATEFTFVPALFSGENLRPMAASAAHWLEYHLTQTGHQLDFNPPVRVAPGRRRIGILVRDILPRTETYLAMGFGAGLDHERFEIILITASSPAATPFSDFVTRHFEQLHVIGQGLAEQVASIRALNLDCLVLGNTMAAQASDFLALVAHRLARIQILPSAIAPVTTGLSRVDYVLTAAATEPARGVQAHYSETVMLMDGPFNCFVLGERDPRLAPAPPALAARPVVFTSGGVIYKLTPELRRCWASLLKRVPDSRLVLYPFNQNWGAEAGHAYLFDRIKGAFAALGIEPERIELNINLSPETIVSILRRTTVYLDTFPYSGAASFIEPISALCPAVTLAGATQRGLQGAAMLAELGLSELITHSYEEYVELAQAIATDPARRAALAERIRLGAATARFLSPAAFGTGFGAALDQIAEGTVLRGAVLA
jgi:Glycosyl transferase family 41